MVLLVFTDSLSTELMPFNEFDMDFLCPIQCSLPTVSEHGLTTPENAGPSRRSGTEVGTLKSSRVDPARCCSLSDVNFGLTTPENAGPSR